MLRGKVLIVFILLFSYTFGFAHNIIPHCDTNHNESSCFSHAHELTHEHKGHHQHNSTDSESQSENHHHIPHSDHFDDNLLEFVKCLFESPTQGHDHCSMDSQSHTQSDNEIKFNDLKFLAVYCSLYEIRFVEENDVKNQFEHIEINSTDRIERNPLRGPPSA